MRAIPVVVAILLSWIALPLAAQAADGASIRAILITASKEKGGSDPRLAEYEATLRRNLPFESFRLTGEGSAQVSADGPTAVSLGRGHRLELQADKGSGGGIRVRVRWTSGGREMMTTALVLRPGIPAVLGRRGDDDEVPVVLVIAN